MLSVLQYGLTVLITGLGVTGTVGDLQRGIWSQVFAQWP